MPVGGLDRYFMFFYGVSIVVRGMMSNIAPGTRKSPRPFRDQYRKLRGAFCFGKEKKKTRLEFGGNETTHTKERAGWAEAMRWPWRTAAARHTETHGRRAHHHESRNHHFFRIILRDIICMLRTASLVFVVLVESDTLHGVRPRAIMSLGTMYNRCAATL